MNIQIRFGDGTHACGDFSHAAGHGCGTGNRHIIAGGTFSFIHSTNTIAQTAGHGALASGSTILGGSNHNIASGNTGAAIIGGSLIKLTGTTYIDTTSVANLAIMTTPSAGVTGDSVLVRRGTTGKIHAVSQSSIAGAVTPIIQIITGNTTITNSIDVVLVTTTGSTVTVTLPASPTEGKIVRIKDRNGNANTNNITISGNGNNIDGSASASITTNYGSSAMIYSSVLDAWFTIAFVN
ncbi:MAG: hypothetical protein HC836_47245 [Richelia sp. RM2_1_2]|nr:hypothetical protein [Richelia sp. RM2_1_2]